MCEKTKQNDFYVIQDALQRDELTELLNVHFLEKYAKEKTSIIFQLHFMYKIHEVHKLELE